MQKSQEEIARQIAEIAHKRQIDKGGNAYILHPQRVAENVHGDEYKAAAWLHDVLEDTNLVPDNINYVILRHQKKKPTTMNSRWLVV